MYYKHHDKEIYAEKCDGKFVVEWAATGHWMASYRKTKVTETLGDKFIEVPEATFYHWRIHGFNFWHGNCV